MRTEKLKGFLKSRGLKISGSNVGFVARVLAASENSIPIAKTAAEIERNLTKE